jgi:hypothetical protein
MQILPQPGYTVLLLLELLLMLSLSLLLRCV